jgi:hypothetical protein
MVLVIPWTFAFLFRIEAALLTLADVLAPLVPGGS